MALLYLLLGALVIGAVVFGVAVLITGTDPGLALAEPDGSAAPLPTDRPLRERDFSAVRFDTGLRGYRMAQVDSALRRAAYDIGYKEELIAVLEAEVDALRAGRADEAEALRRARIAALRTEGDVPSEVGPDTPEPDVREPDTSKPDTPESAAREPEPVGGRPEES